MNNITKYILTFLVVTVSIIAGYYYFKYEGVQGKVLEDLEQAEKKRLKSIDSLKQDIEKRDSDIIFLITYTDSLKEVINKRKSYVPNNDDVDNATPSELEQLLSRYYN